MAAEPKDPTREVPRGGYKKRGPKRPKNPTIDVTTRRRERVEQLWIEGQNIADIKRTLLDETGEEWSRQTLWKDLCAMRERWEKEGSKRSREHVRGELERMARRVFRDALQRKRTAAKRDIDENGKVRVTTVLLPDPDLRSANRAIERIAALHGLNVTTLDGQLSVNGLADLFGSLDSSDDDSEE